MMKYTFASALTVVLGLAQPAYAVRDKYNITPEEHAACDNDAKRLCSDAYPDEDKMLVCMKSKLGQLNSVCKIVFKTGLRKRHMRM